MGAGKLKSPLKECRSKKAVGAISASPKLGRLPPGQSQEIFCHVIQHKFVWILKKFSRGLRPRTLSQQFPLKNKVGNHFYNKIFGGLAPDTIKNFLLH